MSNQILSSLKPSKVWQYFEEICQIPHPSKKEEKIAAYLVDFGKKNNLETLQDEIGNVLIRKPATKGFENKESVVLQSHMDMVCEKNNDTIFDFDKDAIIPYIDNGWVKAKGTTLGADDGIGVAMQLALLATNDIQHGPLECLFTVDEETGLSGAEALKPDFLKSKFLLNLDSEDEGQLFIGCAGGKDTVAFFKYTTDAINSNVDAIKISVSGLKGGHSGDDINKGLGNAVKILNRILWNAAQSVDLRIANIDAGNLRNAIAREGYAIVTLPQSQKTIFDKIITTLTIQIKDELKTNEPGLQITYSSTEMPKNVIDKDTQKRLLYALYACPHGVIAMSPDIKGLVETSTNLASVKFKDAKIVISTSQRSSVESSKNDIVDMVDTVFVLAGAETTHGDGYPGWKPNTNSKILTITKDSYKKLFNKEPLVLAIHAGLECGLIGEKYPEMDMISYGPTLRGVHSPDERIEIESVQAFWDLTLEILKNIPEKK